MGGCLIPWAGDPKDGGARIALGIGLMVVGIAIGLASRSRAA